MSDLSRRDFLTAGAVGAAAVGLGGIISPAEATKVSRVKPSIAQDRSPEGMMFDIFISPQDLQSYPYKDGNYYVDPTDWDDDRTYCNMIRQVGTVAGTPPVFTSDGPEYEKELFEPGSSWEPFDGSTYEENETPPPGKVFNYICRMVIPAGQYDSGGIHSARFRSRKNTLIEVPQIELPRPPGVEAIEDLRASHMSANVRVIGWPEPLETADYVITHGILRRLEWGLETTNPKYYGYRELEKLTARQFFNGKVEVSDTRLNANRKYEYKCIALITLKNSGAGTPTRVTNGIRKVTAITTAG